MAGSTSSVPLSGCFAGSTSSVPISGCSAGSEDLCREALDEKEKGRESKRTRKQTDEKAEWREKQNAGSSREAKDEKSSADCP